MNLAFYKNTTLYMVMHGIIAILVGLSFIFATKELLATIVQVFGFLMLIAGAVISWRSTTINKNTANGFKYLALLQGILLIAIGLFTTFYSKDIIKLIILFIGIWAAISGGSQAYYGIKTKNQLKSNNILIINGLILLIMGLIMIFKHDLFLSLMGIIIGWISLIIGFVTLFFAFHFNRLKKSFKDDEIGE